MVNKVVLVGRIGRAPEVKYIPSGAPVASFSVATTWKDKSGAKQEKTEWHNVIARNKLAEICGEYLNKGMLVYIEGKLSTRSWEGKNGEKRQAHGCCRGNREALGGGKPKENQQAAQPNAAPPGGEEDIPF